MGTIKNKNLLLQENYRFAFSQYQQVLRGESKPFWNYLFITAANEKQKKIYEEQIRLRSERGLLPRRVQVVVLADEGEQRVGSGGATFGVLRYVAQRFAVADFFAKNNCLLLHSGGDSRRIPQYSVRGKLFMPVPHSTAQGERMTLFDEILAMTACVPAKMNGGMMVLTGDVLALCNPLQITMGADDAVVLTAKEPVDIGTRHGVFVKDASGVVTDFLHKQPAEMLRARDAVDENADVNIDTGAAILSRRVLTALAALIAQDGAFSAERFAFFVHPEVCLNFYGDFLYPMTAGAAWEVYREMPHSASAPEQLLRCREALFEALQVFRMRAIALVPATFLHLGTTAELLSFLTEQLEDYACLGWRMHIGSNAREARYAMNNALLVQDAQIGRGSYIEDSILGKNVIIGKNCVVSNLHLQDVDIPDGTALLGILLADGRYAARAYPVSGADAALRWEAPQLPVRESAAQAARDALALLRGQPVSGEVCSMREAVARADADGLWRFAQEIADAVRVQCFLDCVRGELPVSETKRRFQTAALTEHQLAQILQIAQGSDAVLRLRLYYYLAKVCCKDVRSAQWENEAFRTVRHMLDTAPADSLPAPLKICKDSASVRLPLRVNWGGGWSDTPPYCIVHGGTVLNAAITLGDELPVEVVVKRLAEPRLIFESADLGICTKLSSLEAALDFENPLDDFSLHKAALAVFGVLPHKTKRVLREILAELGGGIYLSTAAHGVPRGSGLGTSSILLAACVRALAEFFGQTLSREAVIQQVLRAEQLMNTGGGWQDQVGGLTAGIKLISSQKGAPQRLQIDHLKIPEDAMSELSERFCLIYTGQQRLARTILRDVMGKYLACETEFLETFTEIKRLAVEMSQALTQGDIDAFARLLDRHWICSRRIDESCSNENIDRILSVCDDLLAGRMICGAGGGGFLQVILRKGVSKADLQNRLRSVFAESEIGVSPVRFVFDGIEQQGCCMVQGKMESEH